LDIESNWGWIYFGYQQANKAFLLTAHWQGTACAQTVVVLLLIIFTVTCDVLIYEVK
jgi:hypothetical protein